MQRLSSFVLAFVAIAGAAHGAQPPRDVQWLIDQMEPLNDACRGGSGDDPATMKTCAQRDRKFSQIVKAGWCLGPETAPAYQKTWMQCPGATPDPISERPEKCPMFKGPIAIVCHDQSAAATVFERYGFDRSALAAPHMTAFLQKFGCTPVNTQAANEVRWTSDSAMDQRTARESGWITVGFVKKEASDATVGAWAVATDYLNQACRAPLRKR